MMKKNMFWTAIFAFIVITIQGCASYSGHVEALSLSEPNSSRKYMITSGSQNLGDHDLSFVRNSKMLTNLMTQRGFSFANDGAADAIVYLTYGIGEPNTVYTGSKSTTEYNSSENKLETNSAAEYSTNFTRYLLINAYDATTIGEKNPIQLWKTLVTSTGSSSDLESVMPFLFLMSDNYLNMNSNGKKYIEIYDNDQRLKFLEK